MLSKLQREYVEQIRKSESRVNTNLESVYDRRCYSTLECWVCDTLRGRFSPITKMRLKERNGQ